MISFLISKTHKNFTKRSGELLYFEHDRMYPEGNTAVTLSEWETSCCFDVLMFFFLDSAAIVLWRKTSETNADTAGCENVSELEWKKKVTIMNLSTYFHTANNNSIHCLSKHDIKVALKDFK